ncbi:cytochrome C oxidase subunit IV family protein [Bosea sp. (in: a-proteobacteria)]|uniref:cytochrome C oxidase subunit IV family protein n=1 Tax=Bosea sp. (in: a-proteobacteria) TaxID=1871050 RepID=UPI002613915D|nr:cytochrome C oxidase subunit IV family protein [Bosea sp. (in: a-proteobacteria)]MCO5090007.1 hypothetical protein [Bosea sp. (in: a-proteobacteria)]
MTRDLPLTETLLALIFATGLSLVAAMFLPAGPRGFAIAGLGVVKAWLVVLGFMRLHRASRPLMIALLSYAALLCTLTGLRIVIAG